MCVGFCSRDGSYRCISRGREMLKVRLTPYYVQATSYILAPILSYGHFIPPPSPRLHCVELTHTTNLLYPQLPHHIRRHSIRCRSTPLDYSFPASTTPLRNDPNNQQKRPSKRSTKNNAQRSKTSRRRRTTTTRVRSSSGTTRVLVPPVLGLRFVNVMLMEHQEALVEEQEDSLRCVEDKEKDRRCRRRRHGRDKDRGRMMR